MTIQQPEPMPQIRLKGLQILVCEDDPLLAYDLCSHLLQENAEIIGPFSRIADAEAALAQHGRTIAGAVLDWNLRDGTAHPVASLAARMGIPFVFYSSDAGAVRANWPGRPVLSKHQGDRVARELDCLMQHLPALSAA